MKHLIVSTVIALSSVPAFAASSACVTYVDSSTSPVEAQYSCDGSDLQTLFTATGMSAALSKLIPHFLDQGYTLNGCSEGSRAADNVNAAYVYSRCIFTRN